MKVLIVDGVTRYGTGFKAGGIWYNLPNGMSAPSRGDLVYVISHTKLSISGRRVEVADKVTIVGKNTAQGVLLQMLKYVFMLFKRNVK